MFWGFFWEKNFTTGSRRFHRCRLLLLLLGSHAAGLLNPPFNKGSLTRLVAIVSMTAVNFMYPQAGEGWEAVRTNVLQLSEDSQASFQTNQTVFIFWSKVIKEDSVLGELGVPEFRMGDVMKCSINLCKVTLYWPLLGNSPLCSTFTEGGQGLWSKRWMVGFTLGHVVELLAPLFLNNLVWNKYINQALIWHKSSKAHDDPVIFRKHCCSFIENIVFSLYGWIPLIRYGVCLENGPC